MGHHYGVGMEDAAVIAGVGVDNVDEVVGVGVDDGDREKTIAA
jgi:hypothetical protein